MLNKPFVIILLTDSIKLTNFLHHLRRYSNKKCNTKPKHIIFNMYEHNNYIIKSKLMIL